MWAMERWHIPIPHFETLSYSKAGWPEGHSVLPATLYRGHEPESVQTPTAQPTFLCNHDEKSLLRRQKIVFLQGLYNQSIAV